VLRCFPRFAHNFAEQMLDSFLAQNAGIPLQCARQHLALARRIVNFHARFGFRAADLDGNLRPHVEQPYELLIHFVDSSAPVFDSHGPFPFLLFRPKAVVPQNKTGRSPLRGSGRWIELLCRLLVNQKVAHKLRPPAPLAKISEEAVRKGEAKPVFSSAIHYLYGCNYIGAILLPARYILSSGTDKTASAQASGG
jgi:hypothetical protein